MTTLHIPDTLGQRHLIGSREESTARLREASARLEHVIETPALGPRLYHSVVAAIHELCDALYDAEAAGVAGSEMRRLVARAREIHARSPFIRRLQEWPRGYPGDFQTIEQLVQARNTAPPQSVAHAFETYALSSAIAQQHRNKVSLQAAAILRGAGRGRRGRVLSIGCGSCPDLRSVADQVSPDAEFVLCDSDADALRFSAGQLTAIAGQCRFVQGMVPRVLRRVGGVDRFDVILAGGLFDYLSDRFIVRTLHDAWHHLLAPGGRIVFTNIGAGNPFRVWLEHIASWPLIERSENDLIALCRDAEIPAMPALQRDSTGLSIIAVVGKPSIGAAAPAHQFSGEEL